MSLYKIMIVDDEAEVRQAIARKIDWRAVGFEIVADAENGRDALEKAETLDLDVVLTDIKMPFMDGLELGAELSRREPNLKLIVFSGFDEFEYAKEAIKLNVVEYVLKPVNAAELTAILDRVRKVLDEEIEQRRNISQLTQAYQESLPLLREKFLQDLMRGPMDPRVLEAQAERFALTVREGAYKVAAVCDIVHGGDRRPALSAELVPVSVQQMLSDALRDRCQSEIVLGVSSILIATSWERDPVESLMRILGEVCTECERILGVTLTVGIGRPCQNLEELCRSCGEAVRCPHCDVTLTLHRDGRMMCHYCGHMQPPPAHCPECGSDRLQFAGLGTQKVEQELRELFPDQPILRMDTDTTMSRFAYEEKFGDFAAGKYDIMVGTQMVSKGLNFPQVTLVGVLGTDMSLYSDDFRSFERTFSLLTQVVGRSGRFDLPGRAFIETAQPHNPVFALASAQDYEAFYREEILFRKVNLYPPFCSLLTVQFTSVSEADSHAGARLFARLFTRLAQAEYADLPIRMLGPAGDTLYRVAGKYRCHLILKCRNDRRMRELIRRVLEQFYTQAPTGVQAIPDLD